MMKAATGVLMADRLVISWDARYRKLLRGLRDIVAVEATSLAFVTVILALLMLLRQAVQFAISTQDFPVTFAYLASDFWSDFWHHGVSVLAMYCVVQPVRRLVRIDGARRVAWLVGAVIVGAALASVVRAIQLYVTG